MRAYYFSTGFENALNFRSYRFYMHGKIGTNDSIGNMLELRKRRVVEGREELSVVSHWSPM